MIEDNFQPVALKLSVLNEHISRFIVGCAQNKSKETQGTYHRALKGFLYFFTTDRKFAFRVRDVERYKEYLIKTRKMQEVSVATYLTALRRFCQYLVEQGILEKNPARRVQGGRRPTAHNRVFLKTEEIERLLESIERNTLAGLRDKALILTMLGCACSELEISHARIGDLRKTGSKWYLAVQGKGKSIKDETIPVPSHTAQALQEYINARNGGNPLASEAPLFESYSNRSHGKPMSIRGIREAINLRLKASNVKQGRDLKLTPFSLRHTAGILMAESGASVEEIMHRMRIEWRPTALLYYRQKGHMMSAAEQAFVEVEQESVDY
jgi:site-specific recombinase XerD